MRQPSLFPNDCPFATLRRFVFDALAMRTLPSVQPSVSTAPRLRRYPSRSVPSRRVVDAQCGRPRSAGGGVFNIPVPTLFTHIQPVHMSGYFSNMGTVTRGHLHPAGGRSRHRLTRAFIHATRSSRDVDGVEHARARDSVVQVRASPFSFVGLARDRPRFASARAFRRRGERSIDPSIIAGKAVDRDRWRGRNDARAGGGASANKA